MPQAFFTFLYLQIAILTTPTKDSFPDFDSSVNSGFAKGPRTVLVSPYFPKAWAWIAVLTIIDSLLLKHRKLAYHRKVASYKDACDQNSKPSTPHPHVPSIYHHYFHTLLIP